MWPAKPTHAPNSQECLTRATAEDYGRQGRSWDSVLFQLVVSLAPSPTPEANQRSPHLLRLDDLLVHRADWHCIQLSQRQDAVLAEAVPAAGLVGVVKHRVAEGTSVPLFQLLHKLILCVRLKVQGDGVAGILADEGTGDSLLLLWMSHASGEPGAVSQHAAAPVQAGVPGIKLASTCSCRVRKCPGPARGSRLASRPPATAQPPAGRPEPLSVSE